MKTTVSCLRITLLAIICFLAKQSTAQCVANYTWSVNSNGNVSFTNLSTPSVLTTYTWNFGNGQTSNAVNPIVTYTANNTYDVSLSAFTSTPGCSSFTFAMITVTNVVSTCSANFNYSVGANGTATFISTSLGTNTATPYSWSFGNNTFTTGFGLSGMNASTAYTANGIYTIGLTIGSTVSTCYSNITQTISVTTSTNTSPCNLNQGSYGIASTNTSNVIYINST
ncbi:MAG: PKD domain-containing protein, partial [Bacteroidota bacterium]